MKMRLCGILVGMLFLTPLKIFAEQGMFVDGRKLIDEQPKRLVICLDGTWNNPTMEKSNEDNYKIYKPTNVLKTCRAVKPMAGDGTLQIAYYASGVGGYRKYDAKWNKTVMLTDRILGGARGAGYEQIVEEAYRFLQMNYRPGDEIYIFGFSRGAASARTLVDLIDWMGGVLDKHCGYWLPRFFDDYLKNKSEIAFGEIQETIRQEVTMDISNGRVNEDGTPNPTTKQKERINEILCRSGDKDKMVHAEAQVAFLGLWDTVVELGRSKDKFYVSKKPSSKIRYLRHALAIDERRKNFKPWVFNEIESCDGCPVVEQKWFAGVHSNLGGGYSKDGLANLALEWVHEGISSNRIGLEFRDNYMKNYPGYAVAPLYDSRTPFWRVMENVVQFWKSRGERSLIDEGTGKQSSYLELHHSVIKRMTSCSNQVVDKGAIVTGAYQPKNLMAYLRKLKDLDSYLERIYPDSIDGEDPSAIRLKAKRMIENREFSLCD